MSEEQDRFDTEVEHLAALGEPVRRALYRYVVREGRAVTRDEAGAAVGVPKHVAAFHLDRLEDEGLLESEFRRPEGRGGPGAGRSAKWYRRARREFAVRLPERRYDLAGRLMAEAIERAGTERLPVDEALSAAAVEMGRALGEEARATGAEAGVEAVLERYGYEPREGEGAVILANCPFHALAQDYTELVCRMNLDLIEGVVEGMGAEGIAACLEPGEGRCCVVLRRQ